MPVIPVTRRQLLAGAAAAAALAGFGAPSMPALAEAAAPAAVPLDALLAQQALPDLWIGPMDAKVTIIEYASMTCSHCAAFHTQTYPILKTKYIEPGKARFVLREFPLDPLATAAFMLARTAGDDKRNALCDVLFEQQKTWAFTDKPIAALQALVGQAGMSAETFEACLKDQKLYERVVAERDVANSKFGVNATPTFFINGKRIPGELSPEALDKELEPLLRS